jgi:hypothetical protein
MILAQKLVHRILSGQVQWLTLVIPTTLEAEIRRIKVQDQPRPKSYQDPVLITNKPGMVVHAYGSSYTGGCR